MFIKESMVKTIILTSGQIIYNSWFKGQVKAEHCEQTRYEIHK